MVFNAGKTQLVLFDCSYNCDATDGAMNEAVLDEKSTLMNYLSIQSWIEVLILSL